jgi:hypothetical protein
MTGRAILCHNNSVSAWAIWEGDPVTDSGVRGILQHRLQAWMLNQWDKGDGNMEVLLVNPVRAGNLVILLYDPEA